MIVADLSHQELLRRLAGTGLRLRTGPVVNKIQSRLPRIAHGVALYAAILPALAAWAQKYDVEAPKALT